MDSIQSTTAATQAYQGVMPTAPKSEPPAPSEAQAEAKPQQAAPQQSESTDTAPPRRASENERVGGRVDTFA